MWWRWRAAAWEKGPSQQISHLLHFSLSEPSPIALHGGPGERDLIVCPPSPEGTSCFPWHPRVIPVAQAYMWLCPQLAAFLVLQELLSFDRAPCHLPPLLWTSGFSTLIWKETLTTFLVCVVHPFFLSRPYRLLLSAQAFPNCSGRVDQLWNLLYYAGNKSKCFLLLQYLGSDARRTCRRRCSKYDVRYILIGLGEKMHLGSSRIILARR